MPNGIRAQLFVLWLVTLNSSWLFCFVFCLFVLMPLSYWEIYSLSHFILEIFKSPFSLLIPKSRAQVTLINIQTPTLLLLRVWGSNWRAGLRHPYNRHLAAYKWFDNDSAEGYVATMVSWNHTFWGDLVCLKSRASDWHKLVLSMRSWYGENWPQWLIIYIDSDCEL